MSCQSTKTTYCVDTHSHKTIHCLRKYDHAEARAWQTFIRRECSAGIRCNQWKRVTFDLKIIFIRHFRYLYIIYLKFAWNLHGIFIVKYTFWRGNYKFSKLRNTKCNARNDICLTYREEKRKESILLFLSLSNNWTFSTTNDEFLIVFVVTICGKLDEFRYKD